MILGVDPGQLRGYSLIDETDELPRAFGLRLGRILWAGDRLTHAPELKEVPRCIVEYQYGGRIHSGQIRAADVIKLSFRAGFMLCEAMVTYGVDSAVAITPQAWKPCLFRGGERIEKAIYTNRLTKLVTAQERRIFPRDKKGNLSPDCLDASGLAWALPYLTDAQCALGRVTFDQILPKGSKSK